MQSIKLHWCSYLTAMVLLLSGHDSLAASSSVNVAQQQALLDQITTETDLSFTILNNVDVEHCQRDVGAAQCYLGTITLNFKQDIKLDDWKIYFSNTSNIKWDGSTVFDIKHINGDIHVIKPQQAQNIKAGLYTIEFKGVGSLVSESEAFPNYFMVATGLQARVLKVTVPIIDADTHLRVSPHVLPFSTRKQTKRSQYDEVELASPQWLYHHYATINQAFGEHSTESQKSLFNAERLLPLAQQNQLNSDLRLDLQKGLKIDKMAAHDFSAAFARLAKKGVLVSPADAFGVPLNLELTQHSAIAKQGYQLVITTTSINIKASSNSGLYYGLMSLYQLIDQQQTVATGRLVDGPRYDFRGLHVDIARNFHSKAFLLNLLEQMAALKLNKLHLHLAEDEAWRLQIPGLPELTDVGAFRCFDPLEQHCLMPQLGSGPDRDSAVNGYLSTQDYQDLLRFAAARFIEIIPSLDMPGHSRAAIKAMEARYNRLVAVELTPQAEQYLLTEFADKSEYRSIQHYSDNTLNPCINSTYTFVNKVLDELIKMHAEAGVPLKRYHIGADETAGAWQDSPACQALIAQGKELQSSEQLGAYFVEKVAHIVAQKGIEAAAWDDGLAHAKQSQLPAKIQANIWGLLPNGGYNRAHDFVNRAWDTVLSIPDVLYFDFPYQADPKEPGYYWGARNTDSFQVFQFMPDNLPVHAEFWTDSMGRNYQSDEQISLKNGAKVRGIQAQLWSETVGSDDSANYMLFPRLIAFAERAWVNPNWAVPYQAKQQYSNSSHVFSQSKQQQMYADWASFSQVLLNKVLPGLDRDGVFFRLPTPGAKIENGTLYANAMFSGLGIEFKTINNTQWQVYSGPIKVEGEVSLRSTMPGLSRVSRTVIISSTYVSQE
ncbi:family 20 glycosylhydrolase [Paraglaciecola sp. 25GB23A]|uniref:family 20 glycosylhydrolase n=1 Tax=Paraglaciecola sp. 25GB23A TaxID=3156068 RepID=UPI0032AED9B8